jgi:hypothetical protein
MLCGMPGESMSRKGLFLPISDELNAAFHAEIERRKGRKLLRGDLRDAGEEAIRIWIAQIGSST